MSEDSQLRFVAAALAMQALIQYEHRRDHGYSARADLGAQAVAYADALLVELAKPNGSP